MPDPLSIIAGTTALVGTVIKTTNTVVSFCRGAADLRRNLVFLDRELKSLQGALDTVYRCLQAPKFLQGVSQFEQQSGNSITENFVQTLHNAETSVQHLDMVYAKFFPKSGADASFFERGMKQNKFEHMYDEIIQIKTQIQSHVCALQLGLSSMNFCHQLQNMTANQANAGFNRQNASANRDNADANRQNAAANRENLVMQRAILNQLQTMSKQNKDLGKHQDKLQATQRQTGIESAVGTRMIDDMEKLRLSSLDIESTAKRRMSVVLPMTAVNASIVDENVLPSSPGGSNPESNVQQREALPAVFEDQDQDEVLAEASGRADGTVSNRSQATIRPLPEKRYNSSDDAVRPSELVSPRMRPANDRSVASSPLLGRVTDSPNDTSAITSEEFEEKISSAISSAEKRKKEPKEPFSDSDFDVFASLLTQVGKPRWSERPRTYLVLRLIGHVRAMEGFILEGLNDIEFPYASESQLPSCLRGPRARQDFLQQQPLVLAPKAADLVGSGRHRHIGGDADAGFKDIRSLGKGGQGQVDKVTSKLDLQTYARKRIRKPKELGRNKVAMKTFENEVHNLKRLEHQHLVKFVGSYTDCKFVGIIMEPVADMDLKDYLMREPFPEVEFDILRTFFGCLCSAVRYLHQHNCRHKDIKPANILIKGDHVYITDFGIALDWTELNRETTAGPPMIYTHAYAAPEVTKGEDRNTKSDIWSLGCVFLDILTVLKGKTLEDKKTFLGRTGSVVDISLNKNGLEGWTNTLEGIISDDQMPLQWIRSMLKEQHNDRPTAADLRADVTRSSRGRRYCGTCCLDDEDSDVDSFRGSDTDEEPELTSESYTRGTLISNTESSVSRNDSELYGIDDVGPGHAAEDPFESRGIKAASDGNLDTQETSLTLQDRLTSLLFLEPSKLEDTLLEERKADKKSWESSMIQAGISPATDSKFRSLLHIAVNFADGSLGREVVKLLLQAHASPDTHDFAHNNPLHYAVANQDAVIVKELLAKGSDPTWANLRMQTPLHIAGRLGNIAITKRILRVYLPSMIDLKDDCGKTALHLACESRRVECVVAMLDAGADPHLLDDEGKNAFDLFDTKSYREKEDQDESLLASPSFEDFLNEEFGTASRSRTNLSQTLINESSGKIGPAGGRSCKCQVCKILNALEGVTDLDGDAILACPCVSHIAELADEMLCYTTSLYDDLASCDCIECEKARSPIEDDEGSDGDDKQAAEESRESRDSISDYDEQKYDRDVVDQKCNCDECAAARLASKSAERPEECPPEECPCPQCKPLVYQGHDYWDKRIAARMAKYCRCADCRSRDEIAAKDVLTSAGFVGKKSYSYNPHKAWVWAMGQASTLTKVESVVELLLDYVDDVDDRDGKGRTFLHIAASINNVPLAKLLIDRGAEVHFARDAYFAQKSKYTPLDYAVLNQHFEMMRLLLREGFDLKKDLIVNQVVEGSLFDNTSSLPLLLAHSPDLEVEYEGFTPLQEAVENDDIETARLLIEAGASVDHFTDAVKGMRPISLAIRNRNIKMVDLLLEFDPDVHAYVRNGETRSPVLSYAADLGAGDIVLRLLENSDAFEDIDFRDSRSGQTVLHAIAKATGTNIEGAMRELISVGADVTARDGGGNRPLHTAAKNGNAALAGMLLDEGADEDARNNDKKTACDLAVMARHKDVAEMLGGEVKKKKKWFQRS